MRGFDEQTADQKPGFIEAVRGGVDIKRERPMEEGTGWRNFDDDGMRKVREGAPSSSPARRTTGRC